MAGYSELVLKQFPAENIVLCITRVKDVITNKIETDFYTPDSGPNPPQKQRSHPICCIQSLREHGFTGSEGLSSFVHACLSLILNPLIVSQDW